jgi:hypothetical protein
MAAADRQDGGDDGPGRGRAIGRFRAHTAAAQGERRRARAEWRVRELLADRFLRHVEREVLEEGELEAILGRIAARETDPYSAVDDIIARAAGQSRRSADAGDHLS